MISAMNRSAMPTSGGVILSLRIRAAASCSAARVERSVAHLALRLRAYRCTFGGRQGGGRCDLFEFDDPVVGGDEIESPDQAVPGRRHLAHPAPQLDEQQAVAGAGRLVERSFVAAVARQQHRDHVEIGAELMAQVDGDLGAASGRIGVHEDRQERRRGERQPQRDPYTDRDRAGGLQCAEDEHGCEEARIAASTSKPTCSSTGRPISRSCCRQRSVRAPSSDRRTARPSRAAQRGSGVTAPLSAGRRR